MSPGIYDMISAATAFVGRPMLIAGTIQDGTEAAQRRGERACGGSRIARGSARLLLALSLYSPAPPGLAASAEESFRHGVALYEAERYAEAVEQFETAVNLEPQSSEYHHWLGKGCGRVAEHAVWYRAFALAQRTREEFETAVRLDGNNTDALRDLMEFYRRAPAFLGGSDRKADAIAERLGNPAPGAND